MEVKGIVTKSIAEYVKAHFPEKYTEWEALLNDQTKAILDKRLNLHLWHNVEHGAENPTHQLAKLFFNDDVVKAAWESGRYSAERAFNGVFRMFLLVISPKFLINHAQKLLGTFYKPSTNQIVQISPKHILMIVSNMQQQSDIIEYRIAGWIERSFELANSQNVKIEITKSFAKGEKYTEYDISWE